jgi:hypothetical protein
MERYDVTTTHPLPHGTLEAVFENIWFVRGAWDMPLALKPRISRSMTVIRDAESGDLTLVNSMRLSEEGLKQLEAIGAIKHVVRLASMHGADDGFYRDRYGAKVYALHGTAYTRGLTADAEPGESYFEADEIFDAGSKLPIRNARVYVMDSPRLREASILLDRDGGILLSGDFFHNTPEPDEFTNVIAGIGMRLFGLARPCNMGVGWVMLTKPDRDDLLGILDIPFEHVLPIHGEPVIGNAKERYRPAIETFARKARDRSPRQHGALHERQSAHGPGPRGRTAGAAAEDAELCSAHGRASRRRARRRAGSLAQGHEEPRQLPR